VLAGRALAMIFEKPSLRTRCTFELGMVQLGGHAIYLTQAEIGLGKRESVHDVARNLERWFDLVMARTFSSGDRRRTRPILPHPGHQRPVGFRAPLPGARRRADAARKGPATCADSV